MQIELKLSAAYQYSKLIIKNYRQPLNSKMSEKITPIKFPGKNKAFNFMTQLKIQHGNLAKLG